MYVTKFVAEVSSNHHRDLARCLAFVDTAARIGCRAIKFQLFRINELFAPEILADSEDHRKRRAWELPIEFLPEIHQRCLARGIEFSCTPFYLQAVEDLFPYVAFYKVSSYELMWNDLLLECARTGKPVVLSTGMAVMAEIRHAVEVLREAGCLDLMLLHCVSGYPAPLTDCNLSAIQTLRDVFECPVGWSDHSASPAVLQRAVSRWHADMIEFHLDLDGTGDEFKIGHCWLPAEIEPVIRDCESYVVMDGSGEKVPTPIELPDCPWRADPSDGLRPTVERRARWREGQREIQVKAFRENNQ